MSSQDLFLSHAAYLRTLFSPGSRVCVGLSGGLDSVVLLDCLHRLQLIDYFELFAVHVNHQLSPHAQSWVLFCTELCAQKKIPLHIETVNIARDSGLGIEATAREARYAVFKKQDADFIAFAHHADDQAETLLLQLLRGAGVKGASAMPMLSDGKPAMARPLLAVTRSELEHYAAQRGLKWITDESNADIRYDRNYVRHAVMPLIEKRFPAYRTTLGRAAQHFAEASQLLDELAALDAKDAMQGDVLSQSAIIKLSEVRAKNLLRFFLAQHRIAMPQATRLDELVRQLQTCGPDAEVSAALGEYEVRAWRGNIYLIDRAPPAMDLHLAWHGEALLPLAPMAGVLQFTPTKFEGISSAKLQSGAVTVRTRSGGETLQLAANRPRRSLKNLLQESAVPPWQRERLPLLFCGDELVWVPGIGVDLHFQSVVGEAALNVSWECNNCQG
jgi:tRNA(Ile)-lysidine synthase